MSPSVNYRPNSVNVSNVRMIDMQSAWLMLKLYRLSASESTTSMVVGKPMQNSVTKVVSSGRV